MKTQKFDNEESWMLARRGRITGTKLSGLLVKRGTKKKIGYYEIIAERLALPKDDENAMDRGKRLEIEAIERFTKETGKGVDNSLILWSRSDNESIAISPDGVIDKTEAVEVKCLSSARHVEAILTNEIPKDYIEQVHQYFIVNDGLKKLYLVFYDDRIPKKDFFYLTIKREDIKEEIKLELELQIKTLEEINKIVNEWSY